MRHSKISNNFRNRLSKHNSMPSAQLGVIENLYKNIGTSYVVYLQLANLEITGTGSYQIHISLESVCTTLKVCEGRSLGNIKQLHFLRGDNGTKYIMDIPMRLPQFISEITTLIFTFTQSVDFCRPSFLQRQFCCISFIL